MACYYIQLRSGSAEPLLDPDGVELADMGALKKHVLEAARDLMCADLQEGLLDLRFRVDAEDEQGTVVHTLGFADAFHMIAAI
jgi:hypothetical protein